MGNWGRNKRVPRLHSPSSGWGRETVTVEKTENVKITPQRLNSEKGQDVTKGSVSAGKMKKAQKSGVTHYVDLLTCLCYEPGERKRMGNGNCSEKDVGFCQKRGRLFVF